MSIGFRINKDWARPGETLIRLFENLPVANIADCMNRISCIDTAICPYNHCRLLGPAFTVRCPSGDNLMFHKALDLALPGDIICVAGGGTTERAYCGEIMMCYARERGLGGFIIDGSIRDRDEIAQSDFPVYARGVTPNGPYKNGPGEIGFEVSLGGQVIRPGDILVGDGDGVVVIPIEHAREIAYAARVVFEKENVQKEDILRNLDRSWIDTALREKGCQEV